MTFYLDAAAQRLASLAVSSLVPCQHHWQWHKMSNIQSSQ